MLGHPSLSEYFSSIFPGKVQKIAVNAGLSCPNRDGSKGCGGCIFCNNEAFNPRYSALSEASVSEQLEEGISFFSMKGKPFAYLAYFQSYSNTYGDTAHLIELYEEALRYPGVGGLVIATRPDCLKEDLLDWFESRFGRKAPEGHPYLLVEIGIESTIDRTLELINRGHDYACSAAAALALSERGIDVGAHLILGLPGEGWDDFLTHADRLSELPLKTLKLHHLQVVRGTALAQMYEQDPSSLHLFSPEEYATVVKAFLERLRPEIAIDRLVSEMPRELVLAPAWGLKPSEFQRYLRYSR